MLSWFVPSGMIYRAAAACYDAPYQLVPGAAEHICLHLPTYSAGLQIK